MEESPKKSYIDILRERQKTSRVYTPHQLTGLELAEILGDEEHKSLYMKLAKRHGSKKLIEIARDVADRKGVHNKGAYFMKLLKEKELQNYKNVRKYEKK